MRCRLLTLLGYVTYCCACTYPADLIGEWYSTSFGTLTFTNNSFSGFTFPAISATQLTFTCHVTDGTRYVSTSSFTLFTGIDVQVYLCMNLRQISAIKYIYTLDSNRVDGSNVRVYTSNTGNVTVTDACTYTDVRTAGEYELLILKASIANATISCPLAFLSLFNVTMTTRSVTDCNGTSLDGRTDTSLSYTYSSCTTGKFSSGGEFSCIYTIDDTYTHLNVYNNDTSVDGANTFRFTCYTLLKIGSVLYATEFPGACHLSQSHVAVDSPGISYVMLDPYNQSSELPFDPVLVAVCCTIFGVLSILLVIALIVIYLKYIRKPKTPPPTPPKIRKRKRKMSVTDYLPPLSRSSSQEIPITVNKTSTEEILTGMSEHTEKKAAKMNAEGYHPPKKEAWQKKWEGGRRLNTPAVSGGPPSVRSRDLYSSTNGISEIGEMDLEASKTVSTSLPEYLDLDEYPAIKKTKPEETPTINGVISPRYSERYHATSKMPPSTGKFGGFSKQKSTETVNQASLDPRLDTIAENPLSRENTTAEGRKRKMNSDLFPHYDRRTIISRTTATHSTASIGDVSFQPLSRSSHLSASNASIFDDPTWLTENSRESEATFSLSKNLLPGCPSNVEKDQKWFMTSPQKAEFSREDIAYFKSRTTKKVGINNMVDTIGMRRSSSSLQIIQEEKKRKRDKHKKILPKEVRPKSPKFDD